MLHLMCTLQTLGFTGRQALMQRRHDDRGQTAAEYMGIIVIVAAIIAAIVTVGIPTNIAQGIKDKIQAIFEAGKA